MKRRVKVTGVLLVLIAGALLTAGTLRDPNFWSTPERRGDALVRAGKFDAAAKVYTDPWRIGVAQYRDGDFATAAKTFARVPGATGAFDQGNAWLMRGNYDAAVASYDRALTFHPLQPVWREVTENRALALARKQLLTAAGKDRDQEQTDSGEPDEIVFDQKGDDAKGKPVELADEDVSDAQLRATWLRRVQTTPGDFLRAKFAWQAAGKATP